MANQISSGMKWLVGAAFLLLLLPLLLLLRPQSQESNGDTVPEARELQTEPVAEREQESPKDIEAFVAPELPGDGARRRTEEIPADRIAEAQARARLRNTEGYLVDLLERATESEDLEVRVRSVAELGTRQPDPRVIATCIKALSDPSDRVRLQAASSLESLETSNTATIEALQRIAQEDPSERVRDAARDALETLTDP